MKKILFTILTFIISTITCFAQDINIAFTIDNNYPLYTSLVINSIIKNNTSNSHFNFYIIENDISQSNKKKMTKFVTKLGQNIEFVHFDTNIFDRGGDLFQFSNRITPIAMARIMLPDTLPNVDKVLYMDSDILVKDDLSDLWNTKLDDKYLFGMVKNISQQTHPGEQRKGTYFNSGIILMDLNKCRKAKITTQMLNYLHNNIDFFIYKGDQYDSNVFLYPDQDLINNVLEGKIKTLPVKWNNQVIRRKYLYNISKPCILHYIGPIKPWSFTAFDMDVYRGYYKYWIKSSLRFTIISSFINSLNKNYKNICKLRIKYYNKILSNKLFIPLDN